MASGKRAAEGCVPAGAVGCLPDYLEEVGLHRVRVRPVCIAEYGGGKGRKRNGGYF